MVTQTGCIRLREVKCLAAIGPRYTGYFLCSKKEEIFPENTVAHGSATFQVLDWGVTDKEAFNVYEPPRERV